MTFFCRLDGAPAVQCASPLIQDNLAEGRHFFEVRATTDAGVEETVPAQWSWEVDLTGPITTINSETPQLTNQRTQIFEFVSEETEATFECSLNETEWVDCTSPWSVEGIEGENIWRVRAVDTLGNLEADPNFVSWTLDTQPPTSTWVEQPPSYSGMRTVSFEVSSDETITSYECELDTEAFPCDTTFEVQDLSHGTHAVQLWATDLAGNRQGAALVAEWQTDIEAAVTTVLEAPPAYTNTDVAVFQFEMSEPADLFCGLDELPYETCDPTVTLGAWRLARISLRFTRKIMLATALPSKRLFGLLTSHRLPASGLTHLKRLPIKPKRPWSLKRMSRLHSFACLMNKTRSLVKVHGLSRCLKTAITW